MDCWFQAEAVSEFSLFGLGSGGPPTRLRLVELSAGQKKIGVNAFLLMLLVFASFGFYKWVFGRRDRLAYYL